MPTTNDPTASRRNARTGARSFDTGQNGRGQSKPPACAPKPRPNYKKRPRRPILPMLVRPLLFLAAVALLGAAVWSLRMPQFDVKEVAVDGAQSIQTSEIAGLVPLPAHENLLLYWFRHHKAVADAIVAAEPVVASAHVGIRPPNTLSITVSERQPYALLRQGDRYWVVDRSGIPFRIASVPIDGLPCITLARGLPQPALGQRLPMSPSAPVGAAFALLAALPSDKIATLMKIREITVDQNANLCLNMTNNSQIRLGQADRLAQKLGLVATALSSDSSLAERAAYLDFTDPDRPAWKPRSAAVAASPPTQNLAD